MTQTNNKINTKGKNKYEAEIITIRSIIVNPCALGGGKISITYIANLKAMGETHIWKKENIETALKTITQTTKGDKVLKNDKGNYFLLFPFGFVSYSFRNDAEHDPNTGSMRYKEYEFNEDYTQATQIPQVNPCKLEIRIWNEENKLWDKSETIRDYTSQKRKRIKIQN